MTKTWYIVLAHPIKSSFTHAVCEALTRGLAEAGVAFEIQDLYASNFDPVMTERDFNQFTGKGLPPEVLAEQAKVDQSECLILIYPVWWNDAPAILKGWLDRVLSKGWAYDISAEGSCIPMLKLQRVVIFNTAGNPAALNEGGGLNRAARLTKSLGTFQFCGVAELEHYILDEVTMSESRRREFLNLARSIGLGAGYTRSRGDQQEAKR